MKTLFLIGQCIRLLHTDPWVFETNRIEQVGVASYRVQATVQRGIGWDQPKDTVVWLSQQDRYEVVECPKVLWKE